MCSILGIVSTQKIPEVLISKTPEFLNATINRGPDDQGSVVIDNQVYLGSNRLSIIDISPSGKMPLKSLNGEYWIVFNGEIYNYIELKKQLTGHGFRFKSNSDTEVILNSYIHWGEEFIEKLNGIFAFLIYDKKLGKIVAGRDRFGAKPLYFCRNKNLLFFSSDFTILKDILYIEGKPSWDYSALTAYIQCRFVPGEKTVLKEIFKLQPAEIRIWNLGDLSSTSKQYWNPKFEPIPFNQKTFNEKLSLAIRRTSVADITPDLLLSGGLDSAVIAAILHQQGHKKVQTFTGAFSNPDQILDMSEAASHITLPNIDERQSAKTVAEHLNYKNESFVLNPNFTLATFWKMQKILGEPIASPNALGQYLLAKALKSKTKLLLSGTGSDELLGGYKELYFGGGTHSLKTKRDPSVFMNAFSDFDKGTLPPLKFLKKEFLDLDYLNEFTTKSMKLFPADKYPNELLNQLTFFEMAFALPGWELDQSDRLFMSQSIEVRPAFLENEFVDYSLSIISREKDGKRPLKRSAQGILPNSIIDRPKYPGLGTPHEVCYSKWFNEAVADLLNEPLDIWDKKELSIFSKQPKKDWNFDVLYRLIYLQQWAKHI